MRYSIENGNGAICDKCGKKLLPSQVIKLNSKMLIEDPKGASTGITKTIGKVDLCINCYNKLQEIFIEFNMPRKRY